MSFKIIVPLRTVRITPPVARFPKDVSIGRDHARCCLSAGEATLVPALAIQFAVVDLPPLLSFFTGIETPSTYNTLGFGPPPQLTVTIRLSHQDG